MNDLDKKVNINWFPGHMAKTIKEMKEKINLVDVVLQLLDARALSSSYNPILEEIAKSKYVLNIINKCDLADDNETHKWEQYYKNKNINAIFISLKNKNSVKEIIKAIAKISEPIKQKDIKRGLKPRNIKAMIVGIPNIGKSSLINMLAKRKSAPVANRPGYTKSLKWVGCDGFELLDTPGILWPNLSENDAGMKLALIGSIKQEILPSEEMCKYLLAHLSQYYQEMLYNKYNITYVDYNLFIKEYALKKKHLLKNQEIDEQRSIISILNDFKNGEIGKITLERCGELNG